ncbi:Transcription initiation factor TFIID subunit 12 domain [Dillenia turbinata]|uniref:Transcription initiation factor TFIID subunit 12 domain n=1 Tax=Dillenia turbinata TaxID=194707 RepID=A0AAN8ZM72_9MAGN
MDQRTTTPQPTDPSPRPPPPPLSCSSSSSSSSTSSLHPSSISDPDPNANPINPSPSANTKNPIPNPNPNQELKPSYPPVSQPQQPQQQIRPPFTRAWHPSSPLQHFSPSSSLPLPSSSSSSLPSLSTLPPPRGGVSIGVPAHHPSPPQQPTSFSSLNPPSPFGPQFGSLGRGSVTMPDSVPNSNPSQVRPPVSGVHTIGMIGSLGSGSQLRPSGMPAHQQQRPVQSPMRPPQPTPNPQPSPAQNFQGHGLLRGTSVGSPSSPSPGALQNMQSHNQSWLSSGSQGKPPLPSPSFRPHPQTLQQRSHISQQHHLPSPTAANQQQLSSAQQPQQSVASHQPQEHYGQQFPPSRLPQSVPNQPQIRGQGSGIQKASSIASVQPSAGPSAPLSRVSPPSLEAGESGNRIVSKRSIHELVAQIDPSERLDPEVEDILVDIAEDFVESITTFGCSLAKHRKSTTLEAKDILLHLERNWNMAIPGFSGDEIKTFKKPLTNDVHRERLAAIKKSMVGPEVTNIKSSAGQAAGNSKGHPAKTPANVIGSPNAMPKTRDVA